MAVAGVAWYRTAMRWPIHFLLSAAAMLTPGGAASAASTDHAALAAQEARLAAVSYRLTTGSARWCPVTQPQPGWLLSDAHRFDAQEWKSARAAYGAPSDGAFIAAIAPGSPAARAGLARGTAIAAIEGRPVPKLGDEPTIRMDAIVLMLAAIDPAAAVTVTDSAGRTHRIDAAPGCASSFRIERDGPQAAANGTLVRLTLALARSIDDDAELAAVVAHELAHNILRHRDRLADRRSIEQVRQTEIEADRLGVWLMTDAGYDPAAAVHFWNRHKKPLIRAAGHPPRPARIAAIEDEIAAMRAARAADPAAQPLELRGAFLF